MTNPSLNIDIRYIDIARVGRATTVINCTDEFVIGKLCLKIWMQLLGNQTGCQSCTIHAATITAQ